MSLVGLWWVWLAGAVVLAILETLLPGYVFLGFAAGAAVTGLLLLVGGPLALWLTGSVAALLLVFAVLSLLAWVLLRRLFRLKTGSVKTFDRDINDG